MVRVLHGSLSLLAAGLEALALSADARTLGARVRRTIYTYWDYPNGANPYVGLNLETWLAHSPPGTELVRVNDSNFHELVPDTPEEWYRLPYAAAKSDVVRAAVLYHQGGLYMDTDFVVLGPLGDVFDKLDNGWDVVTYKDGAVGRSGECRDPQNGGYSSNFMAARRGNDFSRTWWENIKAKLTRTCGEGESALEKVCCHEAFQKEPETRKCHIPWAYLEWLKVPRMDPDANGPPRPSPGSRMPKLRGRKGREAAEAAELVLLGNKPALPFASGAKLYCLAGEDSLTPHLNGEVYWQPWDDKGQRTDLASKSNSFDLRFDCSSDAEGDLACNRGNWGNRPNTIRRFFNRTAYHLFFSTRRGDARTRRDVIQGKWLLSELYRKSLGLKMEL